MDKRCGRCVTHDGGSFTQARTDELVGTGVVFPLHRVKQTPEGCCRTVDIEMTTVDIEMTAVNINMARWKIAKHSAATAQAPPNFRLLSQAYYTPHTCADTCVG